MVVVMVEYIIRKSVTGMGVIFPHYDGDDDDDGDY